MKRRDLFAGVGASLLLGMPAAQAEALDYTEGLVQKHLAAGDTVFLDFKASWCSTCAAQDRVIKALKAENPEYASSIVFIDVDWDTYGRSKLVKDLRIPRRSTLVVLKGKQELGRIVAQTGRRSIKALMDTALAAAST